MFTVFRGVLHNRKARILRAVMSFWWRRSSAVLLFVATKVDAALGLEASSMAGQAFHDGEAGNNC